MGKGTLIVLDIPSMPDAPYQDRQTVLKVSIPNVHKVDEIPSRDQLYVPTSYDLSSKDEANYWDNQLREFNYKHDVEFYEGWVGVRAWSPYPIQLISPSKKSSDWIKHRWPVSDPSEEGFKNELTKSRAR